MLFHVPSFTGYGRLSRRSRDEMIDGARVEVAPYKRDPADFVLWKPSTPEQPGWDSPYGRGRPGWHIECSAMVEAHLGVTVDIHGGGQDLKFPHHENELAQSACAHDGAPLARFWLHNGFLDIDAGEDVEVARQRRPGARPAAPRRPARRSATRCSTAHYRKPLDWSDERARARQAHARPALPDAARPAGAGRARSADAAARRRGGGARGRPQHAPGVRQAARARQQANASDRPGPAARAEGAAPGRRPAARAAAAGPESLVTGLVLHW